MSAGPKTPSPVHRRLRRHARARTSGQEAELEAPVHERVEDVFVAATSSGGPKTDAGAQRLLRRVKPPVLYTEDARSSSSFFIGRSSEHALHDIPASPLDGYGAAIDELEAIIDKAEATTPEAATNKPETLTTEPVVPAVSETQLLDNPQQRQSNSNASYHVPPDEDMWRLFECKIGTSNAAQLTEVLAMTPPEGLNTPEIKELHRKCLESQEVIFTQIPWASASAEHSRGVKNKQRPENPLDSDSILGPSTLTWEEELLLEMLAANEGLLSALRTYDALKREAQQRHNSIAESTSSADTVRQGPQAVVDLALPTLPAKVKALKAFTADPDDPDEISFGVGDILDILDVQGKWWLVQDADGSVGIASSDYFSVLKGEDRQTRSSRSSGVLSVYPYASSENGGSFSQEEIFDIVSKHIQWWKARKSYGSSSILSSSNYSSISSSEPETWIFRYKARALYSYTADAGDHREISFSQGEILDIGDKQENWWQARKADGSVGIAPSNFLRLL